MISSCMQPITKLGLSYGAFLRPGGIEFKIYAPNSDKPYTGSVFSLDSLGTKKEEGKYRNGLKDGRWTYYTTVGNGKYEITYKAGIYTLAVFTDKLGTDYTGSPITDEDEDEDEQDGTFLYQDEDKYDFSKYPMGFGTFKDGKPDGLMTGWYPHGQKWREETFKDGQKDGLWIEWHENGQKRLEGNYKDGEEDGLVIQWYENGQKEYEAKFKDGKEDGLRTHWYENGQKKKEGNIKDEKADGLVTDWYKNGQKEEEGTYKDGKKDGLYTWWYENGQKKEEGTFKDDKQDGLWIRWNSDGVKMTREVEV